VCAAIAKLTRTQIIRTVIVPACNAIPIKTQHRDVKCISTRMAIRPCVTAVHRARAVPTERPHETTIQTERQLRLHVKPNNTVSNGQLHKEHKHHRHVEIVANKTELQLHEITTRNRQRQRHDNDNRVPRSVRSRTIAARAVPLAYNKQATDRRAVAYPVKADQLYSNGAVLAIVVLQLHQAVVRTAKASKVPAEDNFFRFLFN
jgi:hypothetical protein